VKFTTEKIGTALAFGLGATGLTSLAVGWAPQGLLVTVAGFLVQLAVYVRVLRRTAASRRRRLSGR
jgi:hypothetical protein